MILSICRLQGANETIIKEALDCLARAGLPKTEYARLCQVRNEYARAAGVGARLALLWSLTDKREGLLLHDLDELPPVLDQPLAAFAKTERGAPHLTGRAISLAHSNRISVCTMAKDGRVGVDVESLDRRMTRAEDIAARCFSKGEQCQLAASPNRDLAFLHIWTRKEALGKALGTGLNADAGVLDTTAYPPDCFSTQTIEGELVTVCILV